MLSICTILSSCIFFKIACKILFLHKYFKKNVTKRTIVWLHRSSQVEEIDNPYAADPETVQTEAAAFPTPHPWTRQF